MTQCALQTSQIKAHLIIYRCMYSCVISSDAYTVYALNKIHYTQNNLCNKI